MTQERAAKLEKLYEANRELLLNIDRFNRTPKNSVQKNIYQAQVKGSVKKVEQIIHAIEAQ